MDKVLTAALYEDGLYFDILFDEKISSGFRKIDSLLESWTNGGISIWSYDHDRSFTPYQTPIAPLSLVFWSD